MSKFQKKIPWSPILISVYAILELWFLNIEQVSPKVIVRPLFIALLGAIAIFGVLNYLLQNSERASILATTFCVGFFSYGHIYILLKGVQVFGEFPFRHRTLFFFWMLLFILVFFWVRKLKNVHQINLTLNWISIVLMSFVIVEIVTFQINQIQPAVRIKTPPDSFQNSGDSSNLPDVY